MVENGETVENKRSVVIESLADNLTDERKLLTIADDGMLAYFHGLTIPRHDNIINKIADMTYANVSLIRRNVLPFYKDFLTFVNDEMIRREDEHRSKLTKSIMIKHYPFVEDELYAL